MQNDKLLQCPFCGGEVKLDEDDFYMFCCDTCGAGVTFAKELPDGTAEDCDKKESIEKWNTRKPMERIVRQLEDKTLETLGVTKEQFQMDKNEYKGYCSLTLYEVESVVRNGGKE